MEALRPLASTLAEALDVETIDRDLFRAVHSVESFMPDSLYGGEVAAQALRAACHTVTDDRFPHSLHGYFLRRGVLDRPVLLHVNRDRDGRSFSARHVNATQNGEVIFSMLASFHVEEEAGTYESEPMAEVPAPEVLKNRRPTNSLIEVRPVIPPRFEGGRYFQSDTLWVRSRDALPDDRNIQACALVYLSDLSTGFGQLDVPGVGGGGSSIDHAMWFHQPVRADDWLLLHHWPDKARGNRGLYHGMIHDQAGRLAATLNQEVLFRPSRFTPEQMAKWVAAEMAED